jgi:hypothetical protein
LAKLAARHKKPPPQNEWEAGWDPDDPPMDDEVPWEPDGPGYYNNIDLLRRGFSRWWASGFKDMPSRQEIEDLDPRWHEDMMTMYTRFIILAQQIDPERYGHYA